jgi:hypothetical protein
VLGDDRPLGRSGRIREQLVGAPLVPPVGVSCSRGEEGLDPEDLRSWLHAEVERRRVGGAPRRGGRRVSRVATTRPKRSGNGLTQLCGSGQTKGQGSPHGYWRCSRFVVERREAGLRWGTLIRIGPHLGRELSDLIYGRRHREARGPFSSPWWPPVSRSVPVAAN